MYIPEYRGGVCQIITVLVGRDSAGFKDISFYSRPRDKICIDQAGVRPHMFHTTAAPDGGCVLPIIKQKHKKTCEVEEEENMSWKEAHKHCVRAKICLMRHHGKCRGVANQT